MRRSSAAGPRRPPINFATRALSRALCPRPRSYADYEDADIALQAAVLAHGIAESQAFIDANKRLALVAMLTFLELNGYLIEASEPDLADWILRFSSGTTPQQLAPSVRDAIRPIA